MKRKIISVLLLICLCVCITACEDEEESIYKDNESEGIVTNEILNNRSPEEFKLDLYHTYKTSIDTYEYDAPYDTIYTLFDIDKNGVPEIIYNVEEGKYKAYSYDGKINVYSGGFKSKSGLYEHNGILFANTSGEGYNAHIKISLNEKYEIYDIGYPYMTKITDNSGNTVKCTYNNEEITANEYEAINSAMKKLTFYPLSDISHLDVLLK